MRKDIVEAIFDAVLNRLKQTILDMEKAGRNQTEIGKALSISQPSVSMYKAGHRGKGITLKTAIAVFRHIGGNMAELLQDVLDQKESAVLIALAADDPDFFSDFIVVAGTSGEEREKLKSEAAYLRKRLDARKD